MVKPKTIPGYPLVVVGQKYLFKLSKPFVTPQSERCNAVFGTVGTAGNSTIWIGQMQVKRKHITSSIKVDSLDKSTVYKTIIYESDLELKPVEEPVAGSAPRQSPGNNGNRHFI